MISVKKATYDLREDCSRCTKGATDEITRDVVLEEAEDEVYIQAEWLTDDVVWEALNREVKWQL